MGGDSYNGEVAGRPGVHFDCGKLAGVWAGTQQNRSQVQEYLRGKENVTGRRWLTRKDSRHVAASLLPPTAARKPPILEFYPINVYTADLDADPQDLLAIAFDIEAAIMEAWAEANTRVHRTR
ncbi:MAG: hypothetical protein ACYTFI_19680 [Planctomycetota bacterium]|jgi:hypothetical protein